jgi:hypothetical protein
VAAAARGNSRGVEVKAAPEDIFFRVSKGMMARRSALSGKIKKLARRPTKFFSS